MPSPKKLFRLARQRPHPALPPRLSPSAPRPLGPPPASQPSPGSRALARSSRGPSALESLSLGLSFAALQKSVGCLQLDPAAGAARSAPPPLSPSAPQPLRSLNSAQPGLSAAQRAQGAQQLGRRWSGKLVEI